MNILEIFMTLLILPSNLLHKLRYRNLAVGRDRVIPIRISRFKHQATKPAQLLHPIGWPLPRSRDVTLKIFAAETAAMQAHVVSGWIALQLGI
jgi:hypothetical protein